MVLATAGFCSAADGGDITLTIEPAVHLNWQTTTNKAYEVQISTNVTGPYIGTGQLIDGRGLGVGAFFTSTSPQEFFRVQQTTSSGLAWLDGIWEGDTTQAYYGDFTTRISIGNSVGSFSGYYTNAGFHCGTTLALQQSSDTQARFFESSDCPCCVQTVVTLTRIDAIHIEYLAYLASDQTQDVVFGTLTKK